MQIHVDQCHALVAAGSQRKAQVGGDKGRAAATLARNKCQHFAIAVVAAFQFFADARQRRMQARAGHWKRQYLAHAGAHGLQQELGRMLRAQHDDGQARILIAESLDGGQVGAIVGRAVEDQHVGQLAHRVELLQRPRAGVDIVVRIMAAHQPAHFRQCLVVP